ncbi:hypothetical protein MPTK1_6g13570 [Marchantia polymorpha subsp. ruderalis]|uniref:Uncharacterized protein n=2 Tax=Marchantia polymorpha TaxID=3197 RepID=A0AAF6BRP4_MARPO|nr:hypothetical protein MARPO_0047s0009 [Marchantia polymorpha]BBN14678.1 hypothetical protein Mp_6g13570 [Marchantia polymorpha subsp. ruderalis]|eukprot:PTQ39017.1 hypothetical protein MARPO_0047s0009 [Marchantia polymorpha]
MFLTVRRCRRESWGSFWRCRAGEELLGLSVCPTLACVVAQALHKALELLVHHADEEQLHQCGTASSISADFRRKQAVEL